MFVLVTYRTSLDSQSRAALLTLPDPYYNAYGNYCQENYNDNYKNQWIYENHLFYSLSLTSRRYHPSDFI